MRDVSGNESGNPFGDKVQEIAKYILNFLKHPVAEISHLPNWSWKVLFWLQVVLSITSSVLAGILSLNIYQVAFGVIIAPFISTTMVLLLTALLYYYFQVFEKRVVFYKALFTLVIFVSLPFFLFQIASNLLPPITLVGFLFSAILLTVGLTDNFQLEKKRSMRLAAILFATIFLVWLWNKVDISRLERLSQKQPETIEIK